MYEKLDEWSFAVHVDKNEVIVRCENDEGGLVVIGW
jgi:hypothetical protein